MGAVIKQWVLHKLGLSVPEYVETGDFEKGLSNGYLLGEILRKYCIISDDQLIALGKSFTERTRFKNMKYIHTWMTEAGLEVNFEDLTDILKEKSGSAISFLYRLYFHLEGSSLQPLSYKAGPVVKIKCPEKKEPVKEIRKREEKQEPCKTDALPRPVVKPAKVPCRVQPQIKIQGQVQVPVVQPKIQEKQFQPQPPSQGQGQGEGEGELEVEYNLEDEVDGEEAEELLTLYEPRATVDIFERLIPLEAQLKVQNASKAKAKAKAKSKKLSKNKFIKFPCGIDPLEYIEKLPCEEVKICPRTPSPSPPKVKLSLESRVHAKLEKCTKFPKSNLPFTGDSMAATNLYFANKATLHAKEALRQRFSQYNQKGEPKRKPMCPESAQACRDFRFTMSIAEEKQVAQMKAKFRIQSQLSKEMGDFDEIMQTTDEDLPSYYSETPSGGADGEFLEGELRPIKANLRSLRQRLERLKCVRKEEAQNEDERATFRKALTSRVVTQEIPNQLYEDLLDTSMQKTMKICPKESELADFMITAHMEKTLFYNHRKLEEEALQRLKCTQMDNLALYRKEQEELKMSIAQTAAKLEEKIAGKIFKAEMKLKRAESSKQVEDFLNALLHFVGQLCDYKAETGKPPSDKRVEDWKALAFFEQTPSTPDEDASKSSGSGEIRRASDSPTGEQRNADCLSNDEECVTTTANANETFDKDKEADTDSSPNNESQLRIRRIRSRTSRMVRNPRKTLN